MSILEAENDVALGLHPKTESDQEEPGMIDVKEKGQKIDLSEGIIS